MDRTFNSNPFDNCLIKSKFSLDSELKGTFSLSMDPTMDQPVSCSPKNIQCTNTEASIFPLIAGVFEQPGEKGLKK